MYPPPLRIHRQSGFSLVEVTLALGIMAFCLIPAFGLLPVGINTNQASINETRAAGVAANICADVHGTLTPANATPRFGVDLSQAGSTKTLFFSATGDAFTSDQSAASHYQYRAIVTVSSSTNPAATWLNIVVSWPAVAANPNGKFLSATAVNIN